MQQFVQRPGSGQGRQPPNRRQQAANAKVQVNRGPVEQPTQPPQPPQPQQHLPARGQGANGGNGARELQQQRQSAAFRSQAAGHVADPFDTDADSIDTTVARSQSYNQNLKHGKKQYDDVVDEDGAEEDDLAGSDDEYGAGADYPEEELLYQPPLPGMGETQQEQVFMRMEKGAAGRAMFNNDQSYPTTTSGVPDDDQYDELEEQDDRDRLSPTPQLDANPRSRHPIQSSHRQLKAHGNPSVQQRSKVFQEGAAIRGTSRPLPGPHDGSLKYLQRGVTDPQSNQLHAYTQSNRQHNAPLPGNAKTNLATSRHIGQTPLQRTPGARAAPAPASLHDPIPLQPNAPSDRRGLVMRQNSHRPPSPAGPSEEVTRTSTPALDYDEPALYSMDYAELRDEDFDKVPRAFSPILPDHMMHGPLQDRLRHVQQTLNLEEQAKFFSQLSIAEWDEAGAWFQERFADIMNRTREARKAKRKLAEDFEKEVEMRHKHVAKKRQNVEQALGQMRQQGQGLVPRTPRNSKSPRPR